MGAVTLLQQSHGAHDLLGTPPDTGRSAPIGTIPALRNRCVILFIFIVAELSCIPLIYWTAAAVRIDAALFPAFPVQTVPTVIYVVVPRLAIRFHAYTSFRPRLGKKIARLPTQCVTLGNRRAMYDKLYSDMSD